MSIGTGAQVEAKKAPTIITEAHMRGRPKAKDVWLVDPGARGQGRLVGRITPGGERRFYFRYVNSRGQQVRLLIGPYDPKGDGEASFTVAQARGKAAEWSVMYREVTRDLYELLTARQKEAQAQEEETRRAAQAAREAAEAARKKAAEEAAKRLTVRQLFERWQAECLRPHVQADGSTTGRKDGGAYVKAQFERRLFPHLGDMPAESVTKAQLRAIVTDAKVAGKLRTAAVLVSDLKQMFAYAEEAEIVPRNPIAGMRRSKEVGMQVERERALEPGELRHLARLLPAARLAPRSRIAIRLILATACRVGEAMGARWEHVDLVARRWHLPETKNGRDHTIHLSDFALAQFEALAALRESYTNEAGELVPSPWVFPATDASKALDIKTLGKQIADRQRLGEHRLSRRAKAVDALCLVGGRWTCHDLRRTAATLMAQLGVSGDVIDECLNHMIESRVRRTYIRDRRPVEQARAFDALGARLTELVSGEAGVSNVVHIGRAA